jgi:hypothetical protein
MAEEPSKSEETWYKCRNYTVNKIERATKTFEMEITGEGNTMARVIRDNRDKVNKVLGVLAQVWPKTNFEFQKDRNDLLIDIRVTPRKDAETKDSKGAQGS